MAEPKAQTRTKIDQAKIGTPTSADRKWAARPALSRLLRLTIFLFPIACAFVATIVARALIPDDTERTLVGWMGLLTLGIVVAIAAEHVGRRWLPLATLLKLSMLFPARAPSRFKVARRAGSIRQLEDLSEKDVGDAGKAAEAILALVTALGAHDRRTRGHAERVRVYTDMIADELELPEADRYRLRWAALLHDIGKLSVDAALLNKSASLTDEDWEQIKKHPLEGVRMIAPLAGWLGSWGDAIAHHHERFDGAGYPAGLARDHIHLGARIVAVADVYDTMTSARSYKRALAPRAAREELVWSAGKQFDPEVVRAFLSISLPRLLWASGPASLLVHLPFLARLPVIGRVAMSSGAQAVTASIAAGVVAVGLVAPAAAPAVRPITEVVRGESQGGRGRGGGDGQNAGNHDKDQDGRDGDRGRDNDGPSGGGGGGGGGGGDGGAGGGGPVDQPAPPPSPEPEPEPEPSPVVERVRVPDVIGMREADATTRLEAAGFVVKVVKRWTDDRTVKNLVEAQSEPAGSTVPEGTRITITVTKWRHRQ
jgi:putative nucleotidyltransferase with HDIG domain